MTLTESPASYRGKPDFPYETFVKASVVRWLEHDGFRVFPSHPIDVKASRGSEVWQIEAKGKTAYIGLDFRTGIGQLIQRMHDRTYRYGLALPDIPAFRRQAGQVAPWVLARLRINLIWVSESGGVSVDGYEALPSRILMGG